MEDNVSVTMNELELWKCKNVHVLFRESDSKRTIFNVGWVAVEALPKSWQFSPLLGITWQEMPCRY